MMRLPTAVPGLDAILNGGLFKGGVYILEGPPGVGKTTLANQIAYTHAKGGGRALYLTMLAESHSRMLQHMENQDFFDRDLVNEAVFYMSGYRELESEGLKGVLSLLRGEMARHNATFIVVDGLIVASSASTLDESVRQFVHELQSLISTMSATCLLLTSGHGRPLSAEQTMVDGIFAFEDHGYMWRAERRLQVKKFRGSEVARGSHTFCITNAGVKFFPRLESLSVPEAEVDDLRHVASGIPPLDEVLHEHGLQAGSSSVVVGQTGSGKTTLAIAFAAAATTRERGVMLVGTETERQLRRLGTRVNIPLEQAIDAGALTVQRIGQGDESLDEMAHRLLRLIDENAAQRVVVDGLSSLVDTLAFQERGYRFMGRLLAQLQARNVTSLFTLDQSALAAAAGTSLLGGVLVWFDNVFDLASSDSHSKRTRTLSLRKLRGQEAAATEISLTGAS